MGKPNHLIDEKSPYLLQHAYNPVEWYPWGEEAFEGENRRQTDLSIHWVLNLSLVPCHG